MRSKFADTAEARPTRRKRLGSLKVRSESTGEVGSIDAHTVETWVTLRVKNGAGEDALRAAIEIAFMNSVTSPDMGWLARRKDVTNETLILGPHRCIRISEVIDRDEAKSHASRFSFSGCSFEDAFGRSPTRVKRHFHFVYSVPEVNVHTPKQKTVCTDEHAVCDAASPDGIDDADEIRVQQWLAAQQLHITGAIDVG